ncbi:ISL3 family transposase [Mycolicibacterium pyrenivorans]|uniref:ISL3 family transposase n=1 Tax=Mycolicibacterium pyrenivorans TaxID=187102 RepID=UPI003FD6EB1D|nr:ISL3 family transposase [Mycolicibacterium pyrenivorans]
MRVSTAFNRLLQIPGASVTDVAIGERDVEVTLRPHKRLLLCPCGKRLRAGYDRRRRRWRHLDLATHRLWLVYEIRRLNCPDCGVVTEQVPWSRPGARHTRDFEDTVLWLAARTDRTTVATLLRCAWETVTAIINRTVDELLDERRLGEIYRLGVDEICYRHPHKYLTIIGDHATGTVIDVQPGRGVDSLAAFYDRLTPDQRSDIEAVSMDGATAFRAATEAALPDAAICYDTFHVMQWTNRALDEVFSAAVATNRADFDMSSGQWRKARTALRTGAERLNPTRHDLVATITAQNHDIGTAWRLKEQLRDLFRIAHPARSPRRLRRWIQRARDSGIRPFEHLARRLEQHFDGIINTIKLGITNGLIEGINAKIRLINARGYGHHTAKSLTSMIYLMLGGISPKLPTTR